MIPRSASLLAAWFGLVSTFQVASGACRSSEATATYNLEFFGEWSQGAFPKQFPTYRKNAQWSALMGAVHNSRFTMWEEGHLANDAFAKFAEAGDMVSLRSYTSRSPDVYSTVGGDAMLAGVGRSTTTLRADREFNKLSFAVRVVPSPDWFVGLSAIDLCHDGEWLHDLSVDLFPYDAGTDQGFMFSSPDFPEPQRKPIAEITSRKPSHPANSFYYPRLAHLPRIAHLTLTKVAGSPQLSWLSMLGDHGPAAAEGSSDTRQSKEDQALIKGSKATTTPLDQVLTPLDCETTTWGGWSRCDDTCRVGLRRRFRQVLQKPKNRGEPCPNLVDVVICDLKLASVKKEKKKCAKKQISKEKKRYQKQQLKNFDTKGKRKFII